MTSSPTATTSTATPPALSVWPTSGLISPATWNTASLFWFGRAAGATANPPTSSPASASAYVDVRVAYNTQGLTVYASVIDYFLWYDPTGASDPRGYDALTLYVDTSGHPGANLSPSDYYFVSGFRYPGTGNDVRWHRQGQGTGSGWNTGWQATPSWTDSIGYRFSNPGPNDNSTLDGGWTTTMTIPWGSLGLAGPPAAGTQMRLGAILANRTVPSPGPSQPTQAWPPAAVAGAPTTWGTLSFDPPPYQATAATNPLTTVIGGLLGGAVQDTSVGGAATCSGGIYGGGDIPHGSTTQPPPPATPAAFSDPGLYIQNESDLSDFPCYAKAFLQFNLGAIPPGKVIKSATLTLHQFGGSGNTGAGVPQPSNIQVFAIATPWNQNTLTWNNEPVAQANYKGTWVNPYQFGGSWSAIPAVTWDVTSLVASAYGANQPASLALYEADTAYDSGKYFVSSATGAWNVANAPSLTITWGQP
jgi:hypothetical protein